MYFYDVRFLSCADDVQVKHSDLKAYKYENKKSVSDSALAAGKRSYCERRGQAWVLSGKRPARLRDSLRELEGRLRDDRALLSRWRSPSLLCIIFSSGLISYIAINPHTSEITRIFFDRYCVGKIPPNATGVVFTDTHLLFTFAENFTILISFNAPPTPAGLEKINSREPKYQTIELYGPTRKSEKRMSVRTTSTGETRLLVWSSSVAGELFPWSPATRGEERANVHVYSLIKSQMSLLCYHRIENEALSVELSQLHPDIVYIVEQKTYQKGGLGVECSSYWAERGGGGGGGEGLRARTCGALGVPAPARAVRRSPCETRILVACIDATVIVHHEAHGVTRTVKAAFIPSVVRWAQGLVLVCEERGRLQCFDLSLAPLPASAAHEDAKFIDIGAHLKRQCTVQDLEWNAERTSGDTTPQFLIAFEGGPLALLHLTLTDSVRRWLMEGQVSRVTSLLRSLSWDTEGDSCLHILHTTVNHLFRKPLNPASELMLQEALGTFHQAASPLSEHALAEYSAPVHDLTRKFFHHLVRYGRLDKALSLAVDLGDSDLFMDVAYAARRAGAAGAALAHEALQHAARVLALASREREHTHTLYLTRRCGRYGRLDKALSLSVDLGDSDLFMDVAYAARRAGAAGAALAHEAQQHAARVLALASREREHTHTLYLTRRCGRYGRLDKALSLSVDLGDSDLFMDVAYAARRAGASGAALAHEAQQHAARVLALASREREHTHTLYLTRRCGRYGRLDKALSLSVDLGDSDLFMDVAYAARRAGASGAALAHEAQQHAARVLALASREREHTHTLYLTRRCGRYGRLDKALSLSVDLGDSDLFMDVAYAARRAGAAGAALAHEAQQHAARVLALASREHSTCSMSSCSQCSSDSHSDCGSLSEAPTPPPCPREKARPLRTAPPLPYVSKPALYSSEPPLPVPIIPPEPPAVLSIRPSIHQYLDREASLWQEVNEYDPMSYPAKYEKKPMHKVVDIIPRPKDETAISMHYNSIYQAELREETNGNSSWHNFPVGLERRPYKSVYGQKSAMSNRYPQSDVPSALSPSLEKSLSSARVNGLAGEVKASASRPPGEKNKVKFSDTVTVAVVPEVPRRERIAGNVSLERGARADPRKELADSLPLCHPNHDYLRDFAPGPATGTGTGTGPHDNEPKETQGKIKVVHFGMV